LSHQARQARQYEAVQSAYALGSHQDHEATDDEEQIDAEMTRGKVERKRLPSWIQHDGTASQQELQNRVEHIKPDDAGLDRSQMVLEFTAMS
jgi:hypothetical protein